MGRLLEPPAGRQVFERVFEPEPIHIDENGHVNNVVYLAWAQDLAIAHWTARAPSEDQDRWAWVVLRHEVDYRRPLKLGEAACGRTWVADAPEGPRFDRLVRIDASDGAMCAQVRTVWCLVDPASGRPQRVPDRMLEMFS
ncbi:MAG: thioesterase [Phenylobacterium sp.]|nr:thioesterase [Phenylobacterium sp.]